MSYEKSMGELYRELSKEQKKINNKKFQKEILKHKKSLFLLFFSTILIIAEGATIPILTQKIIDNYLPKISGMPVSDESVKIIISIILGMIGLVLIRASATFVQTYIVRKFQQKIEMDLKEKIYIKTQKLEISYFDKVNEGFFLSRMMSDTVMAAEYARFTPENLINVVFAFSINFTLIFTYSWIIGFSTAGTVMIMIIIALLLGKKFKNVWAKVKKERDSFNQFLVNSFSGIRETKAYSKRDNEITRYKSSAKKYSSAWRSNFLLYGKWMTSSTLFLSLLPIGMVGIGSFQVINGSLTIGALTALTMYVIQIINPINKFLAVYDLFIRGNVSLSRIYTLLEEKEEKYTGINIKITQGNIEFKNVTLKYTDDLHALNNISFTIKPGEKVAFVGETGAGKSTILKAIIKFYKLNSGSIKIDGQDIKDVNVDSLRDSITLMSQEPYLFFDSVKNNVIFGTEGISEQAYLEIIEKSGAEEFVNELPDKHNTNIGPRGVKLSGGQKQRIALARALLKKSKIVLFDEATSALDNKTEAKIKNHLEKITQDNTVIYIAHRLTTIEKVDRIFVMDKGKIVEEGSWKELIKKKGKFFELEKSSRI